MQDWFYNHKEKGACITWKAMTECGVSYKTLESSSSRGSSSIPIIAHPEHGKLKLVMWEGLNNRYKEKVSRLLRKINKCKHEDDEQCDCGDPVKYITLEPVRELLKGKDFKAEAFFTGHEYAPMKMLPLQSAIKYTREASLLNKLIAIRKDAKKFARELHLEDVLTLYKSICTIITTEKEAGKIVGNDTEYQVSGNFPATYQRLLRQMDEYAAGGYSSLIDPAYGNKSAAKITDEVCEGILLELIAHPNGHDDTMVCIYYNRWAVENGYKTITPAAVAVHRKANEYKILGQRKGNAVWYEKYGKVVHRNRPSAPLLMIGSDDNDLDLYFVEIDVDRDGRKKKNPYFRYKLVVVMDAYNDYILGYSFGDEVTIKLVKAAYLDAVYHIKELTGGWYLPHQIQTDRWGVDVNLTTDLARFYQSIATYTPATKGLARSKYIERAFGTQWHQQLKFYPNYAGTNITSKTRLNRDNVELLKGSFPTKDEGVSQIEDFVNRLRLLAGKDGKTRQQQWVDAFQADERSQEKCISEKKMLLLFGTPHIVLNHQYPEFPNKITKNGIEATINGRAITYDVPDQYYLQNVDKRVQLIWEPYNYKRVLVTDGNTLHFIATEYSNVPGALADFAPGDRTRLNTYLKEKLQHSLLITAENDKRKNSRMQAEGLLQAGVLVKGIKQQAESVYQQNIKSGSRELEQGSKESKDWNAEQDEYRNSIININDFL